MPLRQSPSYSTWAPTRSALVLLRALTDRAAMSPASAWGRWPSRRNGLRCCENVCLIRFLWQNGCGDGGLERHRPRDLPRLSLSTIKLHHGLAKPNASERIGHWSVNRKHCELEFVAGLDFGAKHHAVGHVEALNGSRAGIAAPARHLPVDPDLRIIVDQDVEHRHGRLIANPIDQNPWAHWRSPLDMMRQG